MKYKMITGLSGSSAILVNIADSRPSFKNIGLKCGDYAIVVTLCHKNYIRFKKLPSPIVISECENIIVSLNDYNPDFNRKIDYINAGVSFSVIRSSSPLILNGLELCTRIDIRASTASQINNYISEMKSRIDKLTLAVEQMNY